MGDSFGTYASLPSAASAGAGGRHRTTDSYYDVIVSDGAAWRHLIGGVECKPVNDAGFSWVNQGTASYAQQGGAIVLTAPPGGTSLNAAMRVQTVPASGFQVTCLAFLNEMSQSDSGGGPVFYEASSGRVIAVGLGGSGSLRFNANRYVSATDKTGATSVFNLDVRTLVGANYLWTRMRMLAGVLTWYFSGDGVYFEPLGSEAADSHFDTAPSHIGFSADGANATYSTIITVVDWKVELLGAARASRHISDSLSSSVRRSLRAIY